MAQLKDTVVSGSLRATDTVYSTKAQTQILNIPTTSGGTTYGPGTNGQVVKSNGTSVYWASDNNSDTNVTQTATTTSAAYEVLFSATADNTTRTEGARKTSTLTYNPSTKALLTGGSVDGLTLAPQTTGFKVSGGTTSKTLTVGADYTLGAACAKAVTDNSSNTDVTSSDTNLITGRTLYYQLAKKGYTTNTGTVTKVSTGAGLTGGDITTTGTVKAALTSETKLTNAAADGTETSGRVYPVRLDKNGKLSVNVPWVDTSSQCVAKTGDTMAGWLGFDTSDSSTEFGMDYMLPNSHHFMMYPSATGTHVFFVHTGPSYWNDLANFSMSDDVMNIKKLTVTNSFSVTDHTSARTNLQSALGTFTPDTRLDTGCGWNGKRVYRYCLTGTLSGTTTGDINIGTLPDTPTMIVSITGSYKATSGTNPDYWRPIGFTSYYNLSTANPHTFTVFIKSDNKVNLVIGNGLTGNKTYCVNIDYTID